MGILFSNCDRWRWRSALGGAFLASALVLGCASGGGQPSPKAPVAQQQPAKTQNAPVELTGVTLAASPPDARLELTATGPLVWTQYRDAKGRLVLELPNSRPPPISPLPATDDGLVSKVDVEEVPGRRPTDDPADDHHARRRRARAHLRGLALALTLHPVGAPARASGWRCATSR